MHNALLRAGRDSQLHQGAKSDPCSTDWGISVGRALVIGRTCDIKVKPWEFICDEILQE
jgi:hypothetical protein